MKHNKIRGILALLLVLSVFVSLGTMTAFALPVSDGSGAAAQQKDKAGPGLFDSMNEIYAIIIFKETFDPRGGTVNGSTDKFVVEMPMGRPFRLPYAPMKEGDSFLGWEAVINGETTLFAARQKVNIKELTEFKARWASDNDINPNEAGMKLEARG